jgi:exopolysaccharide biosynthesis polyprenyl glycosylphosphotransferase
MTTEPPGPVIDRSAAGFDHSERAADRRARADRARRHHRMFPSGSLRDGRDEEASRNRSEQMAVAETVLLRVWDLLVVLLVLVLSGAFGAGSRATVARVLVGALALAAIHGTGGYRRTLWLREHPLEVMGRLLIASTIVGWSQVLVTLGLGLHDRFTPLIITWLVLPIAWYAGRQVAKFAHRARPERILVVGTGVVARRVIELSTRPGSTSVVVGCLADGASAHNDEGPPLLGAIEQLPGLLAHGGIDRVIVAFSSRRDYDTLDVLRSCAGYRGAVDIVPRFFDFVGPGARVYSADGLAFLSIPGRRAGRAGAALKRAFDLIGATILLVVLSPLLLAIAVAVLLASGPPVLFRQRRIGMQGTPFSIVKFRTLHDDDIPPQENGGLELAPEAIAAHVERAKQEAARRATRVGAFLRKTSLDELPQLFNVLVGEMSLVGPRPLSPLEDATLEGWEVLRREVRPGITGLWQVSGRSEISWEDRINLDYSQVRHWSFWLDLHVLADTLRAVLHRRGAE